ncbi:hypothetical protein TWF970_002225 [Orbilia oligospora]|uniref:SH3 domain-containing protein n=1 Tax=Orbilia oligospora TaxID=2813651 RepID=A0A7C8RFZ7_ORBOL|nr:hypothetical protein TWF970_002225 [Orbilia oligospora]
MSAGPPYTVSALYDYNSPHEDDLNFTTGQKIKVTEEEGTDWLHGQYRDNQGTLHQGIFPKNYVERVEEPEPPKLPPVPVRPQHDDSKKAAPPAAPADEPVKSGLKQTVTSAAFPVEQNPHPKEQQQPTNRKSFIAPKAKSETPKQPLSPTPTEEEDKPVGSFRDRIAAFNRSTATPLAPTHGQPRSSGFIKKPFVPPPPSKNAFIPPVQQHVEPRRDTETRPPVPKEPLINRQDEPSQQEEPPKVSSLKDRIAMLQSVQLNPAMGVKPKKPPKPPPKKKDESGPKSEIQEANQLPESTSEGDSSLPKASLEIPRKSNEATREVNHDTESGQESQSASNQEGSVKPEGAKPNEGAGDLRRVEGENDEDQNGEEEVGEEGEEGEEGGEEEEEEDVDPEIARRLAIRERIMKMSMSGGMGGMGGMYGGIPMMGGPAAYRPTPKTPKMEPSVAEPEPPGPPPEQFRMIPILPIGKNPVPLFLAQTAVDSDADDNSIHSPRPKHESDTDSPVKDAPTEDESTVPEFLAKKASRPSLESEADDESTSPLKPTSRDSRPPPPPPPSAPPPAKISTGGANVTEGSESDDEMSGDDPKTSIASPVPQEPPSVPRRPSMGVAPPPPPPQRPDTLDTNTAKRTSYVGSPPLLPDSPSTPLNIKRASYISKGGQIPPIPLSVAPVPTPPTSSATRGPPPPPPVGPPVRRSAEEPRQGRNDDDDDEEVTEYEGDIDTELDDSKKTFKDSLGARQNEEEAEQSDETPLPSPQIQTAPPPPRQAPGLPPPPPPPPPSAPISPLVVDVLPSIPPPPLPPTSPPITRRELPERTRPISYIRVPPTFPEAEEEEFGDASDNQGTSIRQEKSHARPSEDRPRASLSSSRRSVDLSRSLHDNSFQARDEDLGTTTNWWTQEATPPPAFQNRGKDIYYEVEDATTSKRGGRAHITRDVYILFSDYSQTIITARFDRDTPANASLEQRHEPPPQPLRQDKLEEAWNSFGKAILEGAKSLENKVVGDGNPSALPGELIKEISGALAPIGNKAYGVTVYQNLGNATIQQLDEIRGGDIITFRNAKFQGHKGGLHQKYNLDLSKTDHVGVVYDWDGTKKKIRIFEQGRESKKVKIESFRIGDLRSGEVKIWRVVGRSWVNW